MADFMEKLEVAEREEAERERDEEERRCQEEDRAGS